MAEDRKYTAKIRAKGLDTTGVTEDHARTMAATLGGTTMLVVEVSHDKASTDAEGKHQVDLKITQCEPVPEHLEDRVREFLRALYRTRPDQIGQSALAGTDPGPDLETAAQGIDAAVERDDDGHVLGVWDGGMEEPLTGAQCDFPGCTREPEHDGDHEPGEKAPKALQSVPDDASAGS